MGWFVLSVVLALVRQRSSWRMGWHIILNVPTSGLIASTKFFLANEYQLC